jgi:hypothetical protein
VLIACGVFSFNIAKTLTRQSPYSSDSLATFNMTPFQLEDVYQSGSVPLITSDDTPEATNKTEGSDQPLSSLRAVNQPETSDTIVRSRAQGRTIPLDNLWAYLTFFWFDLILTGLLDWDMISSEAKRTWSGNWFLFFASYPRFLLTLTSTNFLYWTLGRQQYKWEVHPRPFLSQ